MEKVNTALLFSSMILFALIFGITAYNVGSSATIIFISSASGILFGTMVGFMLCWLRSHKTKDKKMRKEPLLFTVIISLSLLFTGLFNSKFSYLESFAFGFVGAFIGFFIGWLWVYVDYEFKKGTKIGNYDIKEFFLIIIIYLVLSSFLKGGFGGALSAIIAFLIVTLIRKWGLRKNKSKNIQKKK